MKQKQKPPMYRLTLTDEALKLMAASKTSFWPKVAVRRGDGKWDVAVTFNLLDQLKTAALPKENLSDTVLRIMLTQNGTN